MTHAVLFRWAGGIYADTSGTFGDNQFRFALLSLAACEAPLVLNIGGYKCAQSQRRARRIGNMICLSVKDV